MLIALLIIPIIGVIGILLVGENASLQKRVALGASLVNFVLSLVLWGEFDSSYNGFQFVQEFATMNFGHFHIGIDGISIFFVLLTTFTIPICILSSWESIKVGIKYFLIAFLILETLLIAVFVVLDLLLFYICFESTLIPMFLIIGIWGHKAIRASFMLFLFTLFGSLFMLLAILLLFSHAGSTDLQVLFLSDLSESRQKILWLAIFFAFIVKTPLVPVHIWLPLAHTASPLAGSIVLAAIMLKLASYGMLRVLLGILPEASNYFTPLVYAICVVSIIYTSFVTLRQHDIKTIIAYSSIGHMAIVTLGIFSNTIQGIEGSIMLGLAHGIVSPALFICATILYDKYHTRLVKYYRGLVTEMPLFVLLFFVFISANMAVPLSANFVGEFMSLAGAFERNPVLTAFAALSIILSAAYSIWLFNRIAFGASSVYITPSGDLNRREFMTLLPLLVLVFILGICPNIFLDLLHCSVSNLLFEV
jgi:NADH-ubiquinone oxidoreductase chain 4